MAEDVTKAGRARKAVWNAQGNVAPGRRLRRFHVLSPECCGANGARVDHKEMALPWES